MYRYIAVILLIVFALSGTPGKAQQSDLKILSYNSLHGFNGDPVVKARYAEWLKKIDPDVIAYQEMIGYSKKDLADFGNLYGHKYSVIMSRESGVDVTHPLAITSKYPITDVKMVLDSMWHGYLHAKVKGLHVVVTHMAPFTLKDRQKDIREIVEEMRRIPKNEPVLIAGDFNSFSEADSAQYDETLVKSLKKMEGRLEPKSGTPIVKNKTIYRNNLNNGKLDYSVIKTVTDGGYLDAYYLINKKFKNSVPTRANLKPNSILRRIDFIFVNPSLAKRLVYADILQDGVTDNISDHYPVFVKFKLKPSKGLF
jgi:exodeoxyribonuclease-3